MGNREDAEDCYVEAAARIWKNLSYYQPGRSLKSWICTVTVNVCRNMLDAQIRRGKNVTDSLNKEITDSGDELEDAFRNSTALKFISWCNNGPIVHQGARQVTFDYNTHKVVLRMR